MKRSVCALVVFLVLVTGDDWCESHSAATVDTVCEHHGADSQICYAITENQAAACEFRSTATSGGKLHTRNLLGKLPHLAKKEAKREAVAAVEAKKEAAAALADAKKQAASAKEEMAKAKKETVKAKEEMAKAKKDSAKAKKEMAKAKKCKANRKKKMSVQDKACSLELARFLQGKIKPRTTEPKKGQRVQCPEGFVSNKVQRSTISLPSCRWMVVSERVDCLCKTKSSIPFATAIKKRVPHCYHVCDAKSKKCTPLFGVNIEISAAPGIAPIQAPNKPSGQSLVYLNSYKSCTPLGKPSVVCKTLFPKLPQALSEFWADAFMKKKHDTGTTKPSRTESAQAAKIIEKLAAAHLKKKDRLTSQLSLDNDHTPGTGGGVGDLLRESLGRNSAGGCSGASLMEELDQELATAANKVQFKVAADLLQKTPKLGEAVMTSVTSGRRGGGTPPSKPLYFSAWDEKSLEVFGDKLQKWQTKTRTRCPKVVGGFKGRTIKVVLGGGGPENVKGLTIQLTVGVGLSKKTLGTRVVDLQKCGIANQMNREWKKAFGECEAPFVSSITPVFVTFPVMSANRAGNDEEENMELI